MAHLRFRTITISFFFIAMIFFPLLNGKFNIIKDIENTENRKPSSKPEIDITYLDGYPSKFDSYYSDNFTVRQRFIKSFNLLNLVVYKKSPIPKSLVIGNDGWLFMGGSEVDAFQGKSRFSNSEMEEIRLELEYRKQYLKDRNCLFYFIIAPIKASIYNEAMPLNILQIQKQSTGEQLVEYLNTHSNVKPINLFSILRHNKKHGLMYYKLDNHWNRKGAFFATNEILKIINKDLPSVDTFSYADYRVTAKTTYGGNLVSMLSKVEMFVDSTFEFTPKDGFKSVEAKKAGYPVVDGFPYPWDYELVREIPNSNKPKVLIISDSFGENAYPFISEKFSRSVKIFDAWQYKLNEQIVNAEKPDVVLLIALESNIRGMLKFQSRLNE